MKITNKLITNKQWFLDQLTWGQNGERLIFQYLQSIGAAVEPPLYEYKDGETPYVYYMNEKIVATDLYYTLDGIPGRAECKRKSQWVSGYRDDIETGLDNRLYLDYCKLYELTLTPVEIYFIHEFDQTHPENPTGIFVWTINSQTKKLDQENGRRIAKMWITENGKKKEILMTFFQRKDLQELPNAWRENIEI